MANTEQREERPQEEQVKQPEEDRESIWSIPASLKRLYFGLFVTQVVIAAVWLVRAAIADETLTGVPEKILFVWQSMAPLAIASAAFALTITDTWKTSMVLGTYLEDVLRKRRQRQIKAAVDRALAEERQRWQEWNQRREAAAAAGEEFTEPPPDGNIPSE